MDQWGPAGCREHFNEIIDHLREQAHKKNLPFIQSVAEGWINDSIDRANYNNIVEHQLTVTSSQKRSVVWVYWQGGAEGEELRYSLRSAYNCLLDHDNFVVCGDKPDWWRAGHIESPRFNKQDAKKEFGSGRFSKWIDSIVKLQKIIDSPQVTDEFLWLYDDTFFLKKISTEWIRQPKYKGMLHTGDPHKKAVRTWREVTRRTHVSLLERNLSTFNYSTHFPVVYNKHLLQKTIDEFRCREQARLIESLYLNHHCTNPDFLLDHFQYQKRIPPAWSPSSRAAIINVGGFKAPVQRLMNNLYPEKCMYEQGYFTSDPIAISGVENPST